MSKGRYGIHGGQYISETLMNELIHLEECYEHYKKDPEFNAELNKLLKEYDNDNGRVQQPAAAAAPQGNKMGSLFGSSIANELLKLDVMSMTPIEAMSALYKLQDEARKELGK